MIPYGAFFGVGWGTERAMRMDACVWCGGRDEEGLVLLCDGVCNQAFHAHCVGFVGPVTGDWRYGACGERVHPRGPQW